MTDYSVGTTLINVLQANTNPINPAKQGLVFAGRTLDSDNVLSLPLNGNPMPNLYVPFMLQAYKDGLSALVALQQMGFNYVLGTNFTQTIIAPDSVVTNVTTGLCTMNWNSTTVGLQYLIGNSPIGTVTQGSSSGTIVSVYIYNSNTYMVVSPTTGAFNASTITVSVELDTPFPDPNVSDEVCVAAFWFYEQYKYSPVFTTSPNLWISVYITGRDLSISPTATSIVLGIPTDSDVQPDGSYNLTYQIDADNLGLLPTTALGNSIATQNAHTALYNGYTLTSTTCIINVINPTGAFDHTNSLSLVLDITQNGYKYLGDNQINAYGIGYNIHNLTGLQITHADFYNGIFNLQSADAVQSNKFNAKGYYSYVSESTNAIPLNQIIAPDVDYFVFGVKTDVPTLLQYPCNPMMLTMGLMFINLNNDYPYQETSGKTTVLGITASSNISSYPSNSNLNQLCSQGATAIGINGNNQCYIYRNVCTLQTLKGLVDNEYRYMSLQQKLTWLDINLYETAETTSIDDNGTRKNNNPELISTMTSNLLSVLTIGYNNGKGILGNTNNSVNVTLSTTDITKLAIFVTTTIVSANSGNIIQVTVTSFTI